MALRPTSSRALTKSRRRENMMNGLFYAPVKQNKKEDNWIVAIVEEEEFVLISKTMGEIRKEKGDWKGHTSFNSSGVSTVRAAITKSRPLNPRTTHTAKQTLGTALQPAGG